jgi:hypothetical protein
MKSLNSSRMKGSNSGYELELDPDEEAGVAVAADGWRRIREGVGSVIAGELIGGVPLIRLVSSIPPLPWLKMLKSSPRKSSETRSSS